MKQQKNKRRLLAVLACMTLCAGLSVGCGRKKQQETKTEEITAAEAENKAPEIDLPTEPVTEQPTAPMTEQPTAPVTEQPTAPDLNTATGSLPASIPSEFTFSSGAGGWGTFLTLNPDGSFQGSYHDSEMGDSGEGYPNGSVYVCEFQGRFEAITQINETTYSMTLTELTTKTENGKEWIEDEIRYIASEPYGLEAGRTFLLYTPETPVDGLSEEFLSWWPGRYALEGEVPAALDCYGILNQEMGYGFFS